MELPVLLITNGVLLPEAKLKVPIRSKTNLAMLDRFVINKTGPGKSLILVAYRVDQEKRVFETGTIALVEQVVCWRYNNHVQYTLHLVGVSRARIQQFALPVSTVKQLYSIQGELPVETKQEFLALASSLATGITVDSLEVAHEMKKLVGDADFDRLTDLCVSVLSDLSYSSLLDYLSTLDISRRVFLAIEWIKEYAKDTDDTSIERESTRLETVFGPSRGKKAQNPAGIKPRNTVEELEAKLRKVGLPEGVQERVWADFERLRAMGSSPQNQEHHVLTNYLELVASLPWSNATKDVIDIQKARNMLDASHEGMDNVKRRVLEYLAVKKLNDNLGGPILCFAGPPGIGKTSVAKAIAESMGRRFERISLGGIRDESDIRGHRRTYVAAMPGRILQALKHAGTNNPVILLDEVDKLFAGVNGSPSAALLEVLDPEQNNTFVDHYLNLPFDLSNVIFVATANDLSKVDGPLSDRMEIIEMSGYSTTEKTRIALNHIIPRQLLKHGICPDHLNLTTAAVGVMVEGYTRESGVRQLERCVATVCRHAALSLAEALNAECEADCMVDLDLPITVDSFRAKEILGKEKYSTLELVDKMKRFGPGTSFGLAWTPFGGEVLVIETSQCPGTGKVMMTGKLGEVLRESVDVARTWIRANSTRYNIPTLMDCDLHVHLPSGGIDKDGPSAGTAIVSALFSLASGNCVRSDTAMTGEISLNGQVLPVGGIKEKVLGAHRSGIRRVVLPEANRKDAESIEPALREQMEIKFVSDIDKLLDLVMEKKQRVTVLSKL